MSLNQAPDGRPVHFPKNAEAFSFDSEVSAIFDDMARRSIPNFYEAHAAHAAMLAPWITPGAAILDIGASRGAFFKALAARYPLCLEGQMTMIATDISPDMCEYMRRDIPFASVVQLDITEGALSRTDMQFDVVCLHYVLQFLPPETHYSVLSSVMDLVKPGGVLIYGHKGGTTGKLGALMHEEYIKFRLSNGYTREEIAAKTAALKGSMFPLDNEAVLRAIREEFTEVSETFRFMMFNTIFAVK